MKSDTTNGMKGTPTNAVAKPDQRITSTNALTEETPMEAWARKVGDGYEKLQQKWAKYEAEIGWWKEEKGRPPLWVYQYSCIGEFHALRDFNEKYFGKLPSALTMGLSSIDQNVDFELQKQLEDLDDYHRTYTENRVNDFLLPSYLRLKLKRGARYKDPELLQLKGEAAAVRELLIAEDAKNGEKKGAPRRAQELIATTLSSCEASGGCSRSSRVC
jgi:hypothetical protein